MLSMFLTILVVNNGFQIAYINISEIQAIEVVDIDDIKMASKVNRGGILTITLKGNKTEDLAFKCADTEKWEQTKDFLVKSILDINRQMTKNHLDVNVDKDSF